MKQKILTQGHLDGFCLLYSIMNSYKTLTNQNELATKFAFKLKNKKKWRDLISITPSLHNFASGEGSVFGLKDKAEIEFKNSFISSCFHTLSDTKLKLVPIPIRFNEVLETDFTDSCVIICLKSGTKLEQSESGDHWVSIVGFNVSENKILLTCSYTSHEKGLTENEDVQTNKIYNNAISLDEFKARNIYVNEIYKVSKIFT
jgi:hypothetical protein